MALSYPDHNFPPVNGPVALSSAISVDDPSIVGAQFNSATIQISAGYQSGEDVLSFTNMPSITGVWNSNTGTMTLSGVDTLANFTSALQAVKYQDTSTGTPNTTQRTVEFQFTNADGPSNVMARDISFVPVVQPVLTSTEQTPLSYVQSPSPVIGPARNVIPISSTITVTDSATGFIQGATVQITGNYRFNEDFLSFANTANITGIWNSSTGTMTLSGNDTVANYSSALQSVLYTNKASNANTVPRTVSFSVTDANDVPSAPVTRTILVTPVKLSATLSGLETTPLNYLQHSTPPGTTSNNVTQISADITVNVGLDPTIAQITGATVQFTPGTYQSGEDVLVFQNTASITGVFNSVTGKLTLTGNDTLDNYTTALQSVAYTNSSASPDSSTKRTVSFQVTDADGSSPFVSRDILITDVNAHPLLINLETTPLTYTDHPISSTPPAANAVTPISASITATDLNYQPGAPAMNGAVVQIAGNFQSGEDVLSFANTATIQGSWNAATGNLTLTGNDTLADYSAALESVSYSDTSLNPNTIARTISYQVTDTYGYTSSPVSRSIHFVHNDDAPVLSSLEPIALNYIVRNTAPGGTGNTIQSISSTISTSDSDSASLESVTVQITGNYIQGEDQLNFTPISNLNSHIGGSWNSTTGSLTLSGLGTLADYQTALRNVTYTNLKYVPNAAKRTVTFTPTDDLGLVGDPVSRDIVIVGIDTPPVLNNIETTPLLYTDHLVGGGVPLVQGTPVALSTNLSNNITVSSPTSSFMDGATVQITGNYLMGEDQLVFTKTPTITGVWNASTGTMTLTGVDTLANYQTALRSVAYENLAYSNLGTVPSPLMRTVSFQLTDDGNLSSLITTRNIQMIHNDDPPALGGIAGGPLSYTEKTIGLPVAPTITVNDIDDQTLTSATITLTSTVPAEDVLTFVPNAATMGNISLSSFSNGVLTLTSSGATATLVQWQSALESVGYTNTSNNPSLLKRTVSFVVTDSTGLNSTQLATRDITIIPVNDPPLLSSIESTPLNWIENPVPGPVNSILPVTSTLTASDPDSVNASGASIQISGNYQNGQDLLGFNNTPAITGTWNALTGTLMLAGVDTFADYQNALQSVTYTDTSDAPNTATRTVRFTITDDGGLSSPPVTRTISITPTNDPPALSGLESTPLNYTENINSIASIPLTGSIAPIDADSATFSSAVITLTTSAPAEDSLAFVANPGTMGNIAVASNTNDVLTLTSAGATATLAEWQAALRAITYQDSSHNPSSTSRTVSFQITDSGGLPSPTVSRTINVIPVNNPPVIASASSTLSYVEGTGAQPINSAITLNDVDSTTLASAVITLTTFVGTEDSLGFVANAATMGNIGITSNSSGILTLSSSGATASLAQWQAALRAVTYTNTSGNLSPVSRTVTFVVNDGSLANPTSNSLTTTINIAAVFPPVLSASSTINYTEMDPATPINSTILVSDPNSATLASATITMTNFVNGQDQLGFVNDGATMGNISTVSNSSGVLTLTSAGGTATLAQWQSALRAVTYVNTSLNPSATTRNVNFQVNSGGVINFLSNVESSSITVTPVNNPPSLTNVDTNPLSYIESSTATPVVPNLVVADPDSANLTGAVIQIVGNYNAQGSLDTLVFTNTATINGSFDVSTGTLTLTGLDTVANYQAAVRSVAFFNQVDPASALNRTVNVSVIDDTNLSSNTITRVIQITTIHKAPVLSPLETSAQVFKYNDPYSPTPFITSSVIIRDADSTMMSSALVTIATNYNAANERLGFDISGTHLRGSWNEVTGQLLVTGVDTLANYVKALDTVVYIRLGGPFSTTSRTINFQVTDDTGVASNTVSRNLVFTTTNVPPTVATNSSDPLAYTEKNPATSVAPSLTIVDPDSPLIQKAIIKIIGNYKVNEDKLIFKTFGKIRGVFQPTAATLVLTGADTVANYQAALRSILYLNTSNNPSTLPRTVSFTVSDGLAFSVVTTRDITITPINNPPVVTINDTAPLEYSAASVGSGSLTVAPNLILADSDSTLIAGATVTINYNYQRGMDILSFVDTPSITSVFNVATGVLTLTGIDTLDNYRAALSAVMYRYTSTPTGNLTKMISFVANDGQASSDAVSRSITVSA